MKKVKNKKKQGKKSSDSRFSSDIVMGIVASGILIVLAVYFLRGLFPANSTLQVTRFILYGIVVLAAAYAGYSYCSGAKEMPYQSYFFAGVICVLGVYYLVSVSNAWYFGGDAGQYVVLTKSLASFKGFIDMHLIDATPHTLYGFGLPLLLVPVYWLFGANIAALNTMVALTTTGFIAGLYFLFKSELNNFLLVLFVLAVGTNYWVVQFSSLVMTEAPFYMFMTVTFIAAARYGKEESYLNRWMFLVVGLAFFTYQTRAVGLALFPAIFLYLFIKKDYKKAGLFTVFIAVLFIGWNVRNYFAGSLGYFDALIKTTSAETGTALGEHEVGLGLFGNIFWKPVRNLAFGFKYLVPMVFSQEYSRELPWREIAWYPMQILVMIVGYAGFIIHTIKKRAVCDFSMVIIFVGITLYAGVLFTERWWVPLIPFLLFYVVYGWTYISKFLVDRSENALLRSFMKVALVVFLGTVIVLGVKNSNIFIQKTHSSRLDTPSGKAYVEAAKWVKENTPPEARVASRLDKEFFVISDRVGNNAKVWNKSDANYSDAMRDEVLGNMINLILEFDFDYWILDKTRFDSQVTIMVLTNNQEAFNNMFQIVYGYPQDQSRLAYVLKVNKEWFVQEKERRNK